MSGLTPVSKLRLATAFERQHTVNRLRHVEIAGVAPIVRASPVEGLLGLRISGQHFLVTDRAAVLAIEIGFEQFLDVAEVS